MSLAQLKPANGQGLSRNGRNTLAQNGSGLACKRRAAAFALPAAALITLVAAIPGACAQGAYLTDIGLSGNRIGQVFGVSADGTSAAGLLTGGGPTEAMRWTGGVPVGLGVLGTGSDSRATAISATGTVLVGHSQTAVDSKLEAFRWLGGSMTGIGKLTCNTPSNCNPSQAESLAFGVSGDGLVVVGRSASNAMANGEPFRWAGGTMTGLGCLAGFLFQGTATGASGDGSVVVGTCGNGISGRAFRWTSGTGLVDLGLMPGSDSSGTTVANAVNPSGTVIVGYGRPTSSTGPVQGFRWQGGTFTPLGLLTGGSESRALAVNADGSVVVGWATSSTGHVVAVRWTAATGLQTIQSLLEAQGVTVNFSLNEATGISADGQTIVGNGITPANENGGWIVRLPLNPGPATALVSAVLPTSRSVQVGTPATAFSTIINSGAVAGQNCGLSLGTFVRGGLSFQTTNPTTNVVTGNPNIGVAIPPSASQSFVFAVTPTAAFNDRNLLITARCDNSPAAPSFVGVNTLLMSASDSPVPDIVALSATPTADGILALPSPTGAGAFAVATSNVGAAGSITASADTGGQTLPLALSICQTNPTTGACLASPTSSVTTSIGAGATPTFAVFALPSGAITANFALSRIFTRFIDSGGTTRGATSVAVRTN